jgi:hypothetical protein
MHGSDDYRTDRFGFDRFVEDLANELEGEHGRVDNAKLERLITHRLNQMDLTDAELGEFMSRSRHVIRIEAHDDDDDFDPEVSETPRVLAGALRRAIDRMRRR